MTKSNLVGHDGPPGQTSNVAGELAALSELKRKKLRIAWRRYDRVAPPEGLSRDMLIRAIAYKIQDHAFGGMSKSALRRLATLATKLVRNWGGAMPTVLILDDRFEYLGQRFAFLTKIAAIISARRHGEAVRATAG